MARKQSRRTISYNRAVYDAILKAAVAQRMSAAEFVTSKLREAGVELPDTEHLTRAAAFLATTNRRISMRDKANGWR